MVFIIYNFIILQFIFTSKTGQICVNLKERVYVKSNKLRKQAAFLFPKQEKG